MALTPSPSKKSESRRPAIEGVQAMTPLHLLPSLPPASDFRTSLILPDLSRRFTLLRSSSGVPLALEDLRSRFAEQRARGAVHQVSEEEEGMILEALGRMRSSTPERDDSSLQSDPLSPRESSARSIDSSRSVSPSSLSPKLSKRSSPGRRYSNNLFGSGRFRDYSYVRNAQRTSNRTGHSITLSEASSSARSTAINDPDSIFRPTTPDRGSSAAISLPSAPNDSSSRDSLTPIVRSPPFDPPSPYASDANSSAGTDFTFSKSTSSDAFNRASLALEEVIREIEEEAEEPGVDDDIVLLRSPAAAVDQNEPVTVVDAPHSASEGQADYATGTALSSDDQISAGEPRRMSAMSVVAGAYPSSRTTSPTPRLPGYVPGMQRPMTPRDAGLESDDQSSSATPRATSPRLPGFSIVVPPSLLGRRDSNASTAKQPSRTNTPLASGTPLFFSRSVNGRLTPEDRQNGGATESDRDRYASRTRPISPLSVQAFQQIDAPSSSPVPSPSSRPGTPSSIVTWQHSTTQALSRSSHRRSGSGYSGGGSITDIISADMHSYGVALESALERSKSTNRRSVRSPTLPDSPFIASGRPSQHSPDNGQVQQSKSFNDHNRSPSLISGIDLGSPFSLTKSMSPSSSNGYSPKSPASSENGRGRVSHVNGYAPNGTSKSTSKRQQKTESGSSATDFTLSLGAGTMPLVLSPLMNSSRSSLSSEGSSYHSWDESRGRPKDRVKAIFAKVDPDPQEWYHVTSDDDLGSGREEEVVRQLSGLGKCEFATIQDKLIEVVTNKSSDGARERWERTGSALRKRRPSTSQSNYSAGGGKDSRVASPSPAPTRSGSPSAAVTLAMSINDLTHSKQTNQHTTKADALLNSVIDSIQSTKPNGIAVRTKEEDSTPMGSPRARTTSEVSSLTRRNRNLADVLFGPEQPQLPILQLPTIAPLVMPRFLSNDRSPIDNMSTPQLPRSPGSSSPGRLPQGQMSSPNLTVPDQNELTLEVRRKAEAATLALRKSPSNPKFPELSPISRKKIHRGQISSPTLVSASTSVDTIPLRSVSPALSSPSSSKFGQKIKRLRGTLKAKPNALPVQEEGSSDYKLLPMTSRKTSGLRSDPVNTSPINASSSTDLRKPKAQQASSAPSSSAPGFKGFMARFRKNKNIDTSLDSLQRKDLPYSSSSTTSISSTLPGSSHTQLQSAQAFGTTFQGKRSASMRSVKYSQQDSQRHLSQSVSVPHTSMRLQADDDRYENTQKDEAALKQLYDAASDLGLDQAALNNLVARSASTSSRSTRWTRFTTSSLAPSRVGRPSDVVEDAGEPETPDGPEGFSSRVTGPVIRKLSLRKPSRQQQEEVPAPRLVASSLTQLQQPIPREQKSPNPASARNTIIRRTIIMPSETKGMPIDFNALIRKNGQVTTGPRKRRSFSGASINSNRSVQERVPTPPPSRLSVSGRRLSTDNGSPPVPNLPPSFNLDVPPNVDKPSFAYDSLFDMYAGDSSRGPSAMPSDTHSDAEGLPPSDSGPALEVVEMANGETIWSIVNGLRDDDAESFYGNRASFASEYSLRESNSEGVQVYFKEHARASSKGSTSSFLPRRKQSVQGGNRPETKVFFSSSAQIGRLIENLSKGLDSGSFNILPNRPQSHATHPSVGSESDMRWTVEERLEHLLGSIATTP